MGVHREDHALAQLDVHALTDLRVLDHRHPDRVPGDVAERVAAVGEGRRDGAVHVVCARAGAHRRRRRGVVLLVGFEHRQRVRPDGAARQRPGELDPVPAGARDFE